MITDASKVVTTATDPTQMLDDVEAATERLLDDMRCKEPGRPAPGIEHCAACCGGTGYEVADEGELDLAWQLEQTLRVVRRLRGGPR